jgi:hypothetical protein
MSVNLSIHLPDMMNHVISLCVKSDSEEIAVMKRLLSQWEGNPGLLGEFFKGRVDRRFTEALLQQVFPLFSANSAGNNVGNSDGGGGNSGGVNDGNDGDSDGGDGNSGGVSVGYDGDSDGGDGDEDDSSNTWVEENHVVSARNAALLDRMLPLRLTFVRQVARRGGKTYKVCFFLLFLPNSPRKN